MIVHRSDSYCKFNFGNSTQEPEKNKMNCMLTFKETLESDINTINIISIVHADVIGI